MRTTWPRVMPKKRATGSLNWMRGSCVSLTCTPEQQGGRQGRVGVAGEVEWGSNTREAAAEATNSGARCLGLEEMEAQVCCQKAGKVKALQQMQAGNTGGLPACPPMPACLPGPHLHRLAVVGGAVAHRPKPLWVGADGVEPKLNSAGACSTHKVKGKQAGRQAGCWSQLAAAASQPCLQKVPCRHCACARLSCTHKRPASKHASRTHP